MKFAGFVKLFISFYSQLKTFFAEFIIAFFCPTIWVILKQLDPQRARINSPFGFASWAMGLTVNLH